ncbi:ERI1 exoribonuclease 2-like [Saccoglossus kowalevskii]|uniref:ERI1 exoribonuclease 2-like n=1 Tax=Saccoglossus kowalevskii TaxID=10224 RepID=A0ABM0M063_SACKO|nr:PREDICTED: ERI1 exoribonuclease 2-like [Saccoglossus kowalevskii]
MKSTKELARQLGILRKRTTGSQVDKAIKRAKNTNQIFSYLIVIDFESTCWRDRKTTMQEVIEFPAVLLNTKTGDIESEFHHYVQPQECPRLSEFCTELTGISQEQVDDGIPLHVCLSQFMRWLRKLTDERNIAYHHGDNSKSLCTFVTWSDWDLGVCLQYETKRKQLRKPHELNSWIDLRATYRSFYSKKPNGLNGALQDLGIHFAGRQHSGLDDARNTAKLAWRMITDGCNMKITKSLPNPMHQKPKNIGKAPSIQSSKVTNSHVTMAPHVCLNSKVYSMSAGIRKSLTKIKICPNSENYKPVLGLEEISSSYVDNRNGVECVEPSVTVQTRKGMPTNNDRTLVPLKTTLGPNNSVPQTLFSKCNGKLDNPTVSTKNAVNACELLSEVVTTSQMLRRDQVEYSNCLPAMDGKVKTGIAWSSRRTNSNHSNNVVPSKDRFKTPTVPSRFKVELKTPFSRFSTPDMLIGRITPPLCRCGRRAKRRTVINPGPNQGRGFFSCHSGRTNNGKACAFFKWEVSMSPSLVRKSKMMT